MKFSAKKSTCSRISRITKKIKGHENNDMTTKNSDKIFEKTSYSRSSDIVSRIRLLAKKMNMSIKISDINLLKHEGVLC